MGLRLINLNMGLIGRAFRDQKMVGEYGYVDMVLVLMAVCLLGGDRLRHSDRRSPILPRRAAVPGE